MKCVIYIFWWYGWTYLGHRVLPMSQDEFFALPQSFQDVFVDELAVQKCGSGVDFHYVTSEVDNESDVTLEHIEEVRQDMMQARIKEKGSDGCVNADRLGKGLVFRSRSTINDHWKMLKLRKT